MKAYITLLVLIIPTLATSCSVPSDTPVITYLISSPESTSTICQSSTVPIPTIANTQAPTSPPMSKPSPTFTSSSTLDITLMPIQGIVEPWIDARLGTKVVDTCLGETVLFSPDGSLLATSLENKVTLWDTNDFLPRYEFQLADESSYIRTLAFNSNSERLAAVSWEFHQLEAKLFVWDTTNGEVIMSVGMPPARLDIESTLPYVIPLDAISFIPDTERLALASGNTVLLIDPLDITGHIEIDLGIDMYATEISFSDDGRFMYVLMEWWKNHTFPALYSMKNTVQIWDTENHFLWRTLDFPETDWGAELMSLHRSFLIVKNPGNGTLMMMNLVNDERIELPFRQVWEYLSSDNQFIIFVRYWYIDDEQEKGIEIWDADTWRKLYVFRPNYLEGSGSICFDINKLALNSDNTLMAVQNSGLTFIYDIRMITSQ